MVKKAIIIIQLVPESKNVDNEQLLKGKLQPASSATGS